MLHNGVGKGMSGNGKIEFVIDKGKAKRRDLKYYPNWSWKITSRTKEWEEIRLLEPTKKEDNQIVITPTWQQILIALKETIKHELIVDNVIMTRVPNARRYMKY